MMGVFISSHSYFLDERSTNNVYKDEFQFIFFNTAIENVEP